jgi:hypothetical protein
MGQYIVTTPSNSYNGKTCGVLFRAGRAFVSPHTIDENLGLTADEIARKLQEDFGYKVEPVSDRLPVVDMVFAEQPKPVEDVDPASLVEGEAKANLVLPRKNTGAKGRKAGAGNAPEES